VTEVMRTEFVTQQGPLPPTLKLLILTWLLISIVAVGGAAQRRPRI
jgi:hypothetical protein